MPADVDNIDRLAKAAYNAAAAQRSDNEARPWEELVPHSVRSWRAAVSAVLELRDYDESVRWSAALGFGDNSFQSPAASLEQVKDWWDQIQSEAHEHIDCPVWCDDCEQWERPRSCPSCNGSGGDAALCEAYGAFAPCEECGGTGLGHVEAALGGSPLTDARKERDEARAERDAARATAASLEAELAALRSHLTDEIDEIEPTTADEAGEHANWAQGYRAALTNVGGWLRRYPHERAEGEVGAGEQ